MKICGIFKKKFNIHQRLVAHAQWTRTENLREKKWFESVRGRISVLYCMHHVMGWLIKIYFLFFLTHIFVTWPHSLISQLSRVFRDIIYLIIFFRGFIHLGAGLAVGFSGLAAGFAIGIVGDAGVRGTAQQPRLFVGMILILIFAEVLGLYGLIVAIYLYTK